MRLPALLFALAWSALMPAADEPKTTETPKGDTPATKPAEKALKKKKGMGIPEIPEGVTIEDGVKLQAAWVKAQSDETYKAAVAKAHEDDDKPKEGETDKKKKKGGAKEPKSERALLDAALEKAMLNADPSLKAELVRTYLDASHQKAGDRTKKKAK
jgi:hypothetical protein